MTIIHRLTDESGKIYEVSDGIFRRLLGRDDDTVPPGASVRVPTLMMDGRPLANDNRFAPVTDAMRQAVEDARQEYIDRISNQWRHVPETAPGRPPIADHTPRRDPSQIQPMPQIQPLPQPPPHQPIVNDEREAAYAEYLAYLQNAWKADRQ
jgi:hypothetical protein